MPPPFRLRNSSKGLGIVRLAHPNAEAHTPSRSVETLQLAVPGPDIHAGFFTPVVHQFIRLMAGGLQPYKTRKGKAARRLVAVSNLPPPLPIPARVVFFNIN